MSYEYLRTENIKSARKDRYCDGCMALLEIDPFDSLIKEMTEQEVALFTKMKEQNFKILKGQQYTLITGVYEGEIHSSAYSLGIYGICEKFEIFEQ